eukprot:gene3223-3741_t
MASAPEGNFTPSPNPAAGRARRGYPPGRAEAATAEEGAVAMMKAEAATAEGAAATTGHRRPEAKAGRCTRTRQFQTPAPLPSTPGTGQPPGSPSFGARDPWHASAYDPYQQPAPQYPYPGQGYPPSAGPVASSPVMQPSPYHTAASPYPAAPFHPAAGPSPYGPTPPPAASANPWQPAYPLASPQPRNDQPDQ